MTYVSLKTRTEKQGEREGFGAENTPKRTPT